MESITKSLGLSSPDQIRTVLKVPSKLAVSILFLAPSVKYRVRVTRSTANPAGLSKLEFIITLTKSYNDYILEALINIKYR